MSRGFACLGVASTVLAILASASAGEPNSGSLPVVIAVVEPEFSKAPPDGLGYTVSVAGSKHETSVGVIREFGEAGDGTLVLLLHERVSVSAIPGVLVLATKAHSYSNVRLFVFNDARTEMAEVPGLKWMKYSSDPEVVGEFVRRE